METIRKILLLSLTIIFSGTGCKKDKASDNAQATLAHTYWELAYVQNTITNEILNFPSTEPNRIVISFSGTSNVISFKGICNLGEGTYTSNPEKGELSITNLGATKIACVNVEWEGYTIQSLNKAFEYKISGNNLTVYSDGDYDLYFVKQ